MPNYTKKVGEAKRSPRMHARLIGVEAEVDPAKCIINTHPKGNMYTV